MRARLYGLAARLAAERDPAGVRAVLSDPRRAALGFDTLVASAGSPALRLTLERLPAVATAAAAWDDDARREMLSALDDAGPDRLADVVERRYHAAAPAADGQLGEPPARIGMVHGRFQPLHVGHAEYLRAASEQCDELLVGITNPDAASTVREPADDARHLPESNPFTYEERARMVEAFAAQGLAGRAVRVVPFPISEPERWPACCPPETVHFVRIRSAWGREKARRLAEAGFEVRVLSSDHRLDVSGTEVRRSWRSGQAWERLVPTAVADVIRSIPAERAQAAHRAA